MLFTLHLLPPFTHIRTRIDGSWPYSSETTIDFVSSSRTLWQAKGGFRNCTRISFTGHVRNTGMGFWNMRTKLNLGKLVQVKIRNETNWADEQVQEVQEKYSSWKRWQSILYPQITLEIHKTTWSAPNRRDIMEAKMSLKNRKEPGEDTLNAEC